MKIIDLTGKRYGRLEVLNLAELRNHVTFWKCLCDCGNIKVIRGSNLRRFQTKSCGCYAKEEAKEWTKTHGMTHTRDYKSWQSMRERCNNPNKHNYKYYGGRGIKVCERWNSFENFYEDMGKRPENTTLDRIDTEKDYCKDNCRWATKYEQAGNKRNNVVYKGKCAAEAGRELGLRGSRVSDRIRSGWSIEKAFTTPSKNYKHKEQKAF